MLPKQFKFLLKSKMIYLVAEQCGGGNYAVTHEGLPSDEVEYFPKWAVEDFIKMLWWIPIKNKYSK